MTEEEKSKNIGVESLTPFYDRKVRDVFFIVLFILYWIGMVLIAGIALSQGNLDRWATVVTSHCLWSWLTLSPLPLPLPLPLPHPPLHVSHRRLQYGIDSEGFLCGTLSIVNGTTKNLTIKPYLFYFEPWSPSTSYKRCVSRCPMEGDVLCKGNISIYNELMLDNGTCVRGFNSTPGIPTHTRYSPWTCMCMYMCITLIPVTYASSA